ncbi:hypothetical protein BGX24_007383, partial [Mortierella sp. AD032]
TLLSMMRISRSDASSADAVMTEVLAETMATAAMAMTVELVTSAPISTLTDAETTAPKTSAAGSTTPKKPRGRPPKARPEAAAVTTAVTSEDSNGVLARVLLSNDAAPTQTAIQDAGAGSTDHPETGVQGGEPTRQASESAASSRASSVVPEAAPGTPGKKAATPRIARKRKEEEKSKATNRTLTDIWGNAGKNAKDPKAKP